MIRILFIHYNIKGAHLKTIFKTHLNLKTIDLTSTGLLWLSSSGVIRYVKNRGANSSPPLPPYHACFENNARFSQNTNANVFHKINE